MSSEEELPRRSKHARKKGAGSRRSDKKRSKQSGHANDAAGLRRRMNQLLNRPADPEIETEFTNRRITQRITMFGPNRKQSAPAYRNVPMKVKQQAEADIKRILHDVDEDNRQDMVFSGRSLTLPSTSAIGGVASRHCSHASTSAARDAHNLPSFRDPGTVERPSPVSRQWSTLQSDGRPSTALPADTPVDAIAGRIRKSLNPDNFGGQAQAYVHSLQTRLLTTLFATNPEFSEEQEPVPEVSNAAEVLADVSAETSAFFSSSQGSLALSIATTPESCREFDFQNTFSPPPARKRRNCHRSFDRSSRSGDRSEEDIFAMLTPRRRQKSPLAGCRELKRTDRCYDLAERNADLCEQNSNRCARNPDRGQRNPVRRERNSDRHERNLDHSARNLQQERAPDRAERKPDRRDRDPRRYERTRDGIERKDPRPSHHRSRKHREEESFVSDLWQAPSKSTSRTSKHAKAFCCRCSSSACGKNSPSSTERGLF